MPWTIRDVDAFKQGLTQDQKRQWVRIANSVLESCLNDGGNQGTCEASAIRQANGSVNNNMSKKQIQEIQENRYTQTLRAATRHYSAQVRMHQGREHLVVPVIMMVEGVHHGSAGPVLHTAEDLAKYPACWNGTPVVIYHPEDENGQGISANSPEIIEDQVIGRVYNTYFADNKLRAEAWLDIESTGRVSPETLRIVRNGEPLDVSVGVFTDDEPIQGLYNNQEEYMAISRNHRPDHLALLPGARGACSWEDGCGIRTNKNNQNNHNNKTQEGGEAVKLLTQEGKPNISDPDSLKNLKDLAKNGFGFLTVNEQGYKSLTQAIQSKLDRMDTDTRIHFLEEAFDSYFIYRVSSHMSDSDALYKRSYTTNNDGSLEFGDDPIPVVRNVEYTEVMQNNADNNGKPVIFKRTKKGKGEESNMATNTDKTDKTDKTGQAQENSCCPEKVEMLIQSNEAGFTEDDRDWVQSLDEPQVDKLLTMTKKIETKEKEGETPQMNKEQAVQVLKDELSDIKKFKELVPPEIRSQLEYSERLHQEYRQDLVNHIQKNAASGIYTEDELKAMESGSLEKLAKAIKPQVDYSGFGGAGKMPQVNASDNSGSDEVLLPPGVKEE